MKNNGHGLKKIVKESKKFLDSEKENAGEEFCQYIFEEFFRKELRYDQSHSWERSDKEPEVIVDDRLKIKIIFDEVDERSTANRLFRDYEQGRAKESPVEWGIVLSPWGIWLFNNRIYDKGRSEFQTKKTVLGIIYGKNSDQHYFDFFSYDNILGDMPNTNYFRDIAEYKNHYYKGSEKSWPAYSSTLKRFFKFYSEDMGYFKNDTDSVYDVIKITDFYSYIRKETKLEKENTLKNVFFYIKDFMVCMSGKGQFDISTKEMLDGFSKTLKKGDRQDVIDLVKLRKAVQCLDRGKNRERDVAMFLMELSFGLERRKLRFLKWGENIVCNKNESNENGSNGNGSIENEMKIDGKKRSMPKELVKALQKLRDLHIKGEYVFYRTKENGKEPMREDVINNVFKKLVKIDPGDQYYKSLTPANIRASLVRYLLKEGGSLEKIIYLMNIEIWNLGNYISLKDIDSIMEKRIEEKKETGEHLMDAFLKDLLA